MSKVEFYNKYNSKPIEKGTSFKGMEEVCNQQCAEECEISKLLYQFANGDLSELPVVREAQYNDIMITPSSYNDAINLIEKVKNDYYSLPVDTQRAFGNLENYVKDINKIAQGDSETLAKYNNFQVSSPQGFADVTSQTASGTSSSSISRGDNGNGSTMSKPSSDAGSVVKGE